ncbi:PotD/PotF family extracellular solute-binding protein [Desulforhopalus sp. IMCC35007]|uniref:ABC transporter substrate-binding protein n=1 Tax=Desulforhopalus sp. IMCC35007 TaxID=2569543 RepID=UPI0010AE0F60|nr:spermidine/putrescine ABC transporter substrate-binding protein [Desulforhopalus sp. IMCC35007]TKB10846.1 spermidine/putrescine ABC transporter substrate-binding protein [Desulforhopalus sp. IMCC35007]
MFSSLSHAEETLQPQEDGKEILTILNWSDYMDSEVIREFEEMYNVQVKEVYFETEDLRTDMLLRATGKKIDLVVCNDIAIRAYAKIGWIEPLAREEIPNLKYIDPRWQKLSPESQRYGVPYLWGTTGIAYRKDKVTTPVKSWKALFQPNEELRQKILMVNDVGDIFGMALKLLGYSANSTDPENYEEVEKLLVSQRPFVRNYGYISLDESSVLVTGDVWMAMIYNGDAIALMEYQPSIEYIVPDEGGNIWVDYLCVMQSSDNKKLAAKFINFLNIPKNAARIAVSAYYASPNKAAEKLLPEDFLNNPTIYPSQEVLAKSEIYLPLPVNITKMKNSILSRILQK